MNGLLEKAFVPIRTCAGRCTLDGRNAGRRPEDVGGVPGYADFLEAITDPTHEEHDYFFEWRGGSFDPAAFDLVLANQRLSEVKVRSSRRPWIDAYTVLET
ncbi:plasmid pRiA4b ORF-3 family protein [Burkholderia sp. BCC0419]|uniref:plasmid pRiA4b ORF-3 family protein n=1 Tax=Burkholderia sp. BCC0419 TaxID=486878 RepID=UPI001FC7E401|nr:plasmid pRiA4b ORF-3 family protein [Burkholderia sp. BCC0419]